MSVVEEEEVVVLKKVKSEAPPPRKKKKLYIPRRTHSIIIPPREVKYITPDKTTCAECTCFPKEDPYVKPKKLNPCLKSPVTLYELAATEVEKLVFPVAFTWGEDEVVEWISQELGLPQYKECITVNHINGMRLLMFEDPSRLPLINIHYFEHIKLISSRIRQLYGTDFLKFSRSIGLPPRYPLTHCTWFKSRTGPSWGIRKNWTKLDILRWMKIIMPAPVYRDHWDLVWYQKPDFPKVLVARVKILYKREPLPQYKPGEESVCSEHMVPRKFRLLSLPEEEQKIWIHRQRMSPHPWQKKKAKKKPKHKKIIPKETTLMPKKIDLKGLKGRDLILARRRMPKPKFAPQGA